MYDFNFVGVLNRIHFVGVSSEHYESTLTLLAYEINRIHFVGVSSELYESTLTLLAYEINRIHLVGVLNEPNPLVCFRPAH